MNSHCVREIDDCKSGISSVMNNTIKESSADALGTLDTSDVKTYNVLLISGSARVGKTTFQMVLRDVNTHTDLLDRFSCHTHPPMYQSTMHKINDEPVRINMINISGIPSFAHSSNEQGLGSGGIINAIDAITECMVHGISNIDLILVAINETSGMIKKEVEEITSILTILGNQIAPRVCFLITHCEHFMHKDEQQYISGFTSNPNLQSLVSACQGGFLFTGAINKTLYDNVQIRDQYIFQQTQRNIAFFNKLLTNEPVPLLLSQHIMNDLKYMQTDILHDHSKTILQCKPTCDEVFNSDNKALCSRFESD
jgi:hypothetical protein